jgi:hypothetical protein
VIVKHKGRIRALVRYGFPRGKIKVWSDRWHEITPVPWRRTNKAYIDPPRPCRDGEARKILGEGIWQQFFFWRCATVSGYFNLSQDPDYDFPTWGGDYVGTDSAEQFRVNKLRRERVA